MSRPGNASAALADEGPTGGSSLARWLIVAQVMAFSFANHFNRTSMPVAADLRIMAQYRIAPTAMGAVYSAFLLTYLIGMMPGGWFIDRFGTRRALLVVGFGSAA